MLIFAPRRTLFQCSFAVCVVLALNTAKLTDERKFESVQPTANELPEVASGIAAHSLQIARIWPGFWSENQSFLLLSPSGGALLVADWAPPVEYRAAASELPPPLAGRTYTRDGHLPGYNGSRFPGEFGIGEHNVYALPPMGSTLFHRVSFYIHESFHFYQHSQARAWVETPEDSIMGLSPVGALEDRSILKDPHFLGAVEAEGGLLAEAALEDSRERLMSLLTGYLGKRASRLDGRPDMASIEWRYERREGTAEYVGCRAATLAVETSDKRMRGCLTRNLRPAAAGAKEMWLLRWRLYSTGAVLCHALDRLEVRGWRERVAHGEHLEEILADAILPAK